MVTNKVLEIKLSQWRLFSGVFSVSGNYNNYILIKCKLVPDTGL